ncbi:hypothetical protein CDL15_Pgr005035 [Punica granatum]|uniref:Uncharacterized protein n=1 Tax=Punica granatum TaxID=22663 RepID=A0A218WIV5_PUNGR|nr:hypothetical protein CDL15_Pgr005035 [Punica granatum]
MTNDTSGRIPRAYRLSRDTPNISQTPFLTGLSGPDPLISKRHLETAPTGTQGPPGSWNKLQMTFRNSTGFPKGRFSGRKRLLANLWGTIMKDRDHSDPRTPRDIRGTLRKPRSRVPRSSRTNGLRSRTTSQRSLARRKGHRNEH